nr:cell wall hydrolase [uncultured Bacillus sp.]
MKYTHMKTFIAACAAVLLFIGTQGHKTEAMTSHQVQKGDTLWKLGEQNGISVDMIKQMNHRLDDWIYIGEFLQLPDEPKDFTEYSDNNDFETPAQEMPQPTPVISIEEKDLMARLVEAEARGESYEGKVAVATVVLNRMDSPEFPNSITEVIYQVVGNTYAFTPVQNGEINKPASEEALRAVDEALISTDRLNKAVYFYNPKIATDDWIRSRQIIKSIGNHVFAI